MVTEVQTDELTRIGTVAGMIWQFLDMHGPATLSKLAKEVDAPRDAVMQGIGWLAREGKIRFEEASRSKVVALA
jgi:predicted transcriptional regulator